MSDGALAAGIAAYAVTMELMSLLEKCSVISREEGVEVIDRALADLKRTAQQHPAEEPLKIAQLMLDQQLKLWRRNGPGQQQEPSVQRR